jgi:hypothetical protein
VGEEYARHNGHADLLRERIDGTTGDERGQTSPSALTSTDTADSFRSAVGGEVYRGWAQEPSVTKGRP